VLLLVVVALAGPQPVRPQDLVKAPRALQPNEVAAVLEGVRQAIAGQAARLAFAPDGSGPEVLFGPDGRRRLVRSMDGTQGGMVGSDGTRTTWHTTVETIADYTGRPALGCDSTRLDASLLVEYRNEDGKGWTAAARATTNHEVLTPIFDMLDGTTTMESGELRTFGSRTARALVAPWTPPPGSVALDTTAGDPLPNATGRAPAAPRAAQKLWIDVDSLRPLRWEVALAGAPSYALMFIYDSVPAPRIPDGVTPPACVPQR
jgi:hypothetical protein